MQGQELMSQVADHDVEGHKDPAKDCGQDGDVPALN